MSPTKKSAETTAVETLDVRDLTVLYHRFNGVCQACGGHVAFSDLVAGFRNPGLEGAALSKLANRVILHPACHAEQAARPLETYREERRAKVRAALRARLAHIPIALDESIVKKF